MASRMDNELFQPRQGPAPFAVELVLLDDFTLMGLAAIMEPLRAANRAARAELYRWSLASTDGCAVTSSSGVEVSVDKVFDGRTQAQLVMVVASFDVEQRTANIQSGLRRVARTGVHVGGLDGATWALALAGLLDNARATTHWEDLEVFAERFPRVDVVPDRYVVDGRRVTTGGAAPALDLMLDMIAGHHGLALSLEVANAFIYETDRRCHEPQRLVSLGRLAQADPALASALRLMEDHIDDPLPIARIAELSAVSLRTLEARFRDRLNTTADRYYRDMRLAAARRVLQQGRASVSEVAEAHGFSSAAVFARAFRRRYNEAPRDVRSTSKT